MAHSTYFYPSGPDTTESAVKHGRFGYSVETPYGYQIDLDFLKYVDNIERANSIRRLSLQRHFGAANPISDPRGRLGPAQWTSTESLSSGSSDEVHGALFSSSSSSSSSMSHRRPPLPPSHSSPSLSGDHEASQPPATSQRGLEGKPPTAARSPALPRSSHVERTLLETRRRLEQEKASGSSSSLAPEPHPRRRLASFGGVGSSGSISPYTSWKALNQSLQAGSAKLSVAEAPGQGMQLSLGSTSGGSLRHSPLSSGRATPVTGVSPLHLQMVRDQMMVALQRLKELEDQVKAIPVLQVKISVLQEEKRQLVAQVKNLKGEETETEALFRKRAHSTGSAEQLELQRSRLRKEPVPETTEDNQENLKNLTTTGLKEFKQLTAEMQALEKKIKDARLETRHVGATKAPHGRGHRSVAVGDDFPLDEIVILHQSSVKRTKDAATEVKFETRSAAVGVSESMLGASSSAEIEMESQQHTIQVLCDQVKSLEAELKDMALQKEMGRLRNELRNAGARNHKSSTAQPLTLSAGSQTKAQTRSLGVASHPDMQDASTGEPGQTEGWGITVGVSCRPETQCVATGHDTPMEHWSVREKVETCEKCVGDHVSMCSQSVCTETNVREAEVLTEETMATLSQWARKVDQRTVGCGNCTVDVVVTPLQALVSQGTLTDAVKGVDMGVMVTPCTVSQRTNTSVDSVSRFTSTKMAFVTESSTNTCLNTTKEKHTNTMSSITRTIAIGEGRVKDTEIPARMRSIGVGTSGPGDMLNIPCVPSVAKVTRDTGVGLANVHENFLVGLRTRNIACGPSRLPDPTKTRSIGIGVGEGRLRDSSGHWQTLTTQTTQTSPMQTQTQPSAALEPGLDHYIERMQRLLKEQQCLLSESHSELGQVMAQPQAHFTSISTQLASTLSSLDSAVRQTSPEEPQSQPRGSEAKPACETTKKSPGRKKNLLGETKSSDLLGPPSDSLSLKPIIKKKDGTQSCVDSRKNLKHTGLESMAMSEDSCSEDSDSDGAVEAPAMSERRGGSSGNRPVAQERKNRGRLDRRDRYELSEKTLSACHTLKAHLSDGQSLTSREVRSCLNTLQQEWFRVSSQKAAQAGTVGDFLSATHRVSPLVQSHVANMADGNGNMALHYSVSHSNFSVVKKLLDADVCNVDQQNKAGYTPIMLAALAAVESRADMSVVEELFRKGDVNAKASQAGQTALMLAVSHGRMDMVRALLMSGSEVNIQDDEGSTALMCASEHGHADIVKLLLSQPGCDATLSDNDESTALSIALEAGHKDIAMLLYAHVNFSKGQTPGTPRLGHRPQIQ